jgi:proteasome accessory factor B
LSPNTFNRTFERDKAELLALGVPIEVGEAPDGEDGYRVRRASFELPPVEFTAAEAAMVALAGSVWQSAAQSEQAVQALAKLRAAGLNPDPGRALALAPAIRAEGESFDTLAGAIADRCPVSFGYQGQTRHLQPRGLASRHGAWYVKGFDTDRGEPRTFKLSRFSEPARRDGRPGSFPPTDPGFDKLFTDDAADAECVVEIRPGAAPSLSRRGKPAGHGRYRFRYGQDGQFAAELAGYGADVLVVEPAELRDEVAARLRAIGGRA